MTIDEIKTQLEQLQPLTDQQIQAKVDAGADAGELLAEEAAKEPQRRALQFQLNTLEKKAAEARRLEAQKALAKLHSQMEKVEGHAAEQVAAAWDAVKALGNALEAFRRESDEHARLSRNAQQQARQAGLHVTDTAGLWLSAHPMEVAIIGVLHPFRRGQPFNTKLIEQEA